MLLYDKVEGFTVIKRTIKAIDYSSCSGYVNYVCLHHLEVLPAVIPLCAEFFFVVHQKRLLCNLESSRRDLFILNGDYCIVCVSEIKEYLLIGNVTLSLTCITFSFQNTVNCLTYNVADERKICLMA